MQYYFTNKTRSLWNNNYINNTQEVKTLKKRYGNTILFSEPPSIISHAAVAGKKEGEGPLANEFDLISEDDYFGKDSWEAAESSLQNKASMLALDKANLKTGEIDFVISGDLQNQCTATHYSMRLIPVPFLGIYGACSTICEAISLSAMLVSSGYGKNILCGTSSHFCSAEKQFRFPLEYGSIRTPVSQWTVTASGFCVVSENHSPYRITHATIGRIIDKGITDINNMGGAMAAAAADTIITHFKDTGRNPSDYDLILTGDLGAVGSDLLKDILNKQGYDIYSYHQDCGMMIFDKTQDAHAGGSGCGCCASVLCGHILNEFERGNLKRIAVIATGALMNPTTVLQGESIPGIAHLITIEKYSD